MIMEFLHFTFYSFWHFLGVAILLEMIVDGIVHLVRGFKDDRVIKEDE